jgi:hypothetical protein
MAVVVPTSAPAELLKAIKDKMAEGGIDTWSVDSDGDFTHTPPQWKNEAWLRPRVETDRLVFTVLTPKGKHLSGAAYAVYHGRFIEMLLAHFDLKFSTARATAMPDLGDNVDSSG